MNTCVNATVLDRILTLSHSLFEQKMTHLGLMIF